jgi:hypothetical protein
MPTFLCTKSKINKNFTCKEFNDFKKASQYFNTFSYISNDEKVIFNTLPFLPSFLKNWIIWYKLSKETIKIKLIKN